LSSSSQVSNRVPPEYECRALSLYQSVLWNDFAKCLITVKSAGIQFSTEAQSWPMSPDRLWNPAKFLLSNNPNLL
jgi:hypothetical protein